MPALSPTMEEGKLVKWLVREGDSVRAGDVIAEIETDKATMEVEAAEDGKLGKILVAEGSEHVPVNRPIALLSDRRRGCFSLSPRGRGLIRREPAKPGPHRAKGEGAQAMRSHFPLTPTLSASPGRGSGPASSARACPTSSRRRRVRKSRRPSRGPRPRSRPAPKWCA